MIYLDHAATTPPAPEALEAMHEAYREAWGNPSAIAGPGPTAAAALAAARGEIARHTGATPAQVVFTAGGTEANSLAILGSLRGRRGGHLVASAIEHPSVLRALELAGQEDFEIDLVAPGPGGVVDPARFAQAVRPDTAFAALMHVNNELGTVQPIAEVFAAVKAKAPRALTLTDCVQSFTRLPLTPPRWRADFVTVSAHKIGGPRGVGALIATGRLPQPILGGGDQEQRVRPGTVDVPGIVGFAAAARARAATYDTRRKNADGLAAVFLAALRASVPQARVNGDRARCVPDIISVSVPGMPSEALIRALDDEGVCVSAGSACHAGRQAQSHVLRAIAVDPRLGTVRITSGPDNTAEDLRRAAAALGAVLERYAI